MENQKTFKLIDSDFSAKDSREILTSVFSSKINFHQMKNFSQQERFGKGDDMAKQRIEKLKKSLNEIIKFIEEAEKNGQRIEIKSDVVLNYINDTKNV